MAENDDYCTICHRPKADHTDEKFRHRYSPPGGSSALFARDDQRSDASSDSAPVAQGVVGKLPMGDLVLRMAMLRKGLLTVADLDEVEAELRATGVSGFEPRPVA
jgi:hypothetical protein